MKVNWKQYGVSILLVLAATAIAWVVNWHGDPANLIMIYMLAAACASTLLSRGPAILTVVFSVATFDYLFVPPLFEFTPTDSKYLFTLAVMLVIALMICELTSRARQAAWMWKKAEEANLRANQERMRSALLSSVSHDLRTPLSSITGAASSLLASLDSMSRDTVKELIQSIYDEADRLNRLVGNLVEMTRLSCGAVQLKKDWNSLEEVVGAAIVRLERRLSAYKVKVKMAPDLPLVAIDPVLMEQLFINLLDNAVKYSPAGSEVLISARIMGGFLQIVVFNTGSQLASGEEKMIFEKFYRGRQTLSGGGVGLGLAICQAIVQAHGGQIKAANVADGVSFMINLPMAGQPPAVPLEAAE